MTQGAISGDRVQQARNNIASRRQSGLAPRPEDLADAQLEPKERTALSRETPEAQQAER